ncbi:MAG: glutamate---cysteine ligase / carboxylate-amine ligase [Actinomycetota bacterium]|nr:glutamate---cysteine ligase / carboxylate-amine ligase [Actinomycetota bacterium]
MAVETTFDIGVEEEYFLIDPVTRALSPAVDRVLPLARDLAGDSVATEMQQVQIEIGTDVCGTLREVRAELVRLRAAVVSAAGSAGTVIAASGTHPFSDWRASDLTQKESYLRLGRDYGQIAREQLVCGCHVHVGMPGRDETIEILNRAKPWLSPIRALAVNSPFWAGSDTGYASYRSAVWLRWPMAGTPDAFSSWEDYEDLVRTLEDTGSIDEPARIYWDIRPSAKFQTLEFRVTDVCMTVDETVMVAGLIRALARACHLDALRGTPPPSVRPELMQAATWRASRYGLDGDLVDVVERRSMPAGKMVAALLDFVGPALDEFGERDEVASLVEATLRDGTGAARQRRSFAQAGRPEDVVDYLVQQTSGGG